MKSSKPYWLTELQPPVHTIFLVLVMSLLAIIYAMTNIFYAIRTYPIQHPTSIVIHHFGRGPGSYPVHFILGVYGSVLLLAVYAFYAAVRCFVDLYGPES